MFKSRLSFRHAPGRSRRAGAGRLFRSEGCGLAHPQPAVPHEAYHGDVHRAPAPGDGSALKTSAPTMTRLVPRLSDGEIAFHVQRERPARAGRLSSCQIVQHGRTAP